MRIVVATFGQESDAAGFMRELRKVMSIPVDAIAVATAGASNEPHDGHRLVVVEVAPGQHAAVEICSP